LTERIAELESRLQTGDKLDKLVRLWMQLSTEQQEEAITVHFLTSPSMSSCMTGRLTDEVDADWDPDWDQIGPRLHPDCT
jgi:predicted XRE-type DNA-binding protein